MSVVNLDRLFRPESIALFGLDQGPHSVGRVVATNLFRCGFDGPVMPVHPSDMAVQGVLAYASVADLPLTPDLAVIASPPEDIPPLITALGERGTRAAVVLSHAFEAAGTAEGASCRRRMLDAARPFDLRIAGPACLGIIVPARGLDASYAHARAAKGDLAFISQSGSLMTVMLDWAAARGVGFSLLASLGDMSDVDFGDMLDYLAFDGGTRAILLCIDSIANPRRFLSAARSAARLKPVIVFDVARLDVGRERRRSGARRPTRGEVNDAAFRRAGILPVDSLADLIAAAGTLGTGIRMANDRIAIIANGHGIGDVTANMVLQENGRLAELSRPTLDALDRILPARWGRRNPVNLFNDATAERYRDALGPLLADPGVDAILTVVTPTAIGDTIDAAYSIADRMVRERKPLVAVWAEESSLDDARRLFATRRLPLHDAPGPAVAALMQLVRYRRSQDMLMETPASLPEQFGRDAGRVRAVVSAALKEGREWLSEPEAKEVLAAYDLPVARAVTAATPEDAVSAAKDLGFPVSLRLQAPGETGAAVRGRDGLGDLETPEAVAVAARQTEARFRRAYVDRWFPGFTVRAQPKTIQQHELRMGMFVDADFGPVIIFGPGGDIAQVIRERALALPPLNLNLAYDLIAEAQACALLQGYGERPAADIEDIGLALVKLSQLVVEIAEIVEIDINPMLAGGDGVVVVAARIRIAATGRPADARLAIRPYPKDVEKMVFDRGGRQLLLRAIRPEDEPALRAFVRSLSPEDRRLRFFSQVKELDHRLAARMTQIDYDREMALVLFDETAEVPEMLGVMRITADPDETRAEYAGAVRSDLKGTGLGRLLMEEIIAYCRKRGISEIWGDVLAENAPMLGLVRKLGFVIRSDPEDRTVRIVSKSLD
ncbi:MAG: bifunctional acetate--CoA ligase family protein/GNAT family N-acetyltransferase [Rhodospirillales bacterium]|nr:bifunctional acetate--CoA ligase family protein/GNAT family N-acetyltransferase [Rhodospirillales bacterium]